MSCDSLTIGDNTFQSLLAKNVKDQCINSRLKIKDSNVIFFNTVVIIKSTKKDKIYKFF